MGEIRYGALGGITMAKDKRKEQIAIQLERWQIKEIKHRAVDLEISMSELVRRIISDWLEKEQNAPSK